MRPGCIVSARTATGGLWRLSSALTALDDGLAAGAQPPAVCAAKCGHLCAAVIAFFRSVLGVAGLIEGGGKPWRVAALPLCGFVLLCAVFDRHAAIVTSRHERERRLVFEVGLDPSVPLFHGLSLLGHVLGSVIDLGAGVVLGVLLNQVPDLKADAGVVRA